MNLTILLACVVAQVDVTMSRFPAITSVRINDVDAVCMLHTGSSKTAISIEFQKLLRRDEQGLKFLFENGDTFTTKLNVSHFPSQVIKDRLGLHVDAVLGMDLLRGVACEFDPRKNGVVIIKDFSSRHADKWVKHELRMDDDLPSCDYFSENLRMNCKIDTGRVPSLTLSQRHFSRLKENSMDVVSMNVKFWDTTSYRSGISTNGAYLRKMTIFGQDYCESFVVEGEDSFIGLPLLWRRHIVLDFHHRELLVSKSEQVLRDTSELNGVYCDWNSDGKKFIVFDPGRSDSGLEVGDVILKIGGVESKNLMPARFWSLVASGLEDGIIASIERRGEVRSIRVFATRSSQGKILKQP